jgi:hypothetical protein
VASAAHSGAKSALLGAILYQKTIVLPRQARDKHRGEMRKRAFFLSQEGGGFPHHLQNTYDYLGLDKYAFAVRKNARPFWPPLLDQTINLPRQAWDKHWKY